MKVLVVHRQKKIIDGIKSVLQAENSIFRFLDSGLDGLLAARIEVFDLIICSTDLPVITGFEMIRSLRNDSLNKKTPVILLVDELEAQVQQLATALGVSAVLEIKRLDNHLIEVVNESVRIAPDLKWEDLSMGNRLN